VFSEGVRDDAIVIAKRKVALINDAYDRLRRQRGLVPA
jgi:DnaJ like chaperone protein